MRRSLFTLLLGTGLVGCALSLGCHHSDHGCPTCGGHAASTSVGASSPYPGTPAVASRTAPYGQSGSSPVLTPTSAQGSMDQVDQTGRPSSTAGQNSLQAH